MADVRGSRPINRRRFLRQSAAVMGAALGADVRLPLEEPPPTRTAQSPVLLAAGAGAAAYAAPSQLLVGVENFDPTRTNLDHLTMVLNGTLQTDETGLTLGYVDHTSIAESAYVVLRYSIEGRPASRQDSVVSAVASLFPRRFTLGIQSVIPNWVVVAAPSHFLEGGPGGPPASATPSAAPHFTYPSLPPPFTGTGQGTTVIVLDTSPGGGIPARAAAEVQNAAGRYPANTLLAGLAPSGANPIDWRSVPVDPGIKPTPVPACRPLTAPAAYPMPDHGLFVAGVVRDIARQCSIRVIRVLNDWGAAYLHSLIAGLATGGQSLGNGPLVVNMSLVVRAQTIAPYPNIVSATMPLYTTLQWLQSQGVVFVAAAGNDSAHARTPRPADVPAAYSLPLTMGVAAVNRSRSRACYSNTGDIATFGGDSSGMVYGLYSSPDFPGFRSGPGAPNATGWAGWIGTSFATPIIAGLAANLLANGQRPASLWSQFLQLAPTIQVDQR